MVVKIIFRSLLQKTYEVEDCYDYDPLTTNNNKFSGTGLNPVYSNTGLCITGNRSSDSFYLYQSNLPSKFSIELEFVSRTYPTGGSYTSELYVNGCEIGEHKTDGIFYGNGSLTYIHTSLTSGDILKAEYDGSNVKLYRNDSLIATLPSTNSNVGFKTYNQRNMCFKNLKIKAL